MDILRVQEIKKMMNVTRVPNTPMYVKGVINLRGSVLPVVDLRARLGLAEIVYTQTARIIVVRMDDTAVGFIVDEVVEVTTIATNMIDSGGTSFSGVSGEYLQGVGKEGDRLFIILQPSVIVESTKH